MSPHFAYPRRVAFHETDTMGVVHHSNHIKYFEEARVEWLRSRGMVDVHVPYGPYTFAVAGLEARYYKTARFDDELEVWVQGKLEGIRIHFRYAVWSKRLAAIIAEGSTVLVPLNPELKPTRLPRSVQDIFAQEPFSETWSLPTTAP